VRVLRRIDCACLVADTSALEGKAEVTRAAPNRRTGTLRTWCDVWPESVMRIKADVR
jgi:hypothetical protein